MIKNWAIIVAAFVLACGLAFSSIVLAGAGKSFYNFNRYVDVKGLDERIVKSNLATWQISFTTSANELTQIYQTASDAQKIIVQFLLNAGFNESEIEREAISVTDNRADAYVNYADNRPRYKASAGIVLVTNNVDLISKTSQTTSVLVQDGIVLTSSNVRYTFTDLNVIKSEMIDRATENARETAESFAKVAKAHLGTIRHAQQGVFTITSAGASEYDDASIMKKVRIVTSVQFFLNN